MTRCAPAPTPSQRRTTTALLAGVGAWNLVQNLATPRKWYGVCNLAGSMLAYATGRRLGLSAAEMGFGRGALRRGLRWAGPIAAAASLGATIGVLVPGLRRLFRDERVEPATVPSLLREVGFQIPVGTALFEETVFRGLLLGWLTRSSGRRRALVESSVAFGLWHVLPTWQTAGVYRSGVLRRNPILTAATVGGGVAGTAATGAALTLLRRRADSVVAPIVVHAAVNIAGYTAAWAEARTRAASPVDEAVATP